MRVWELWVWPPIHIHRSDIPRPRGQLLFSTLFVLFYPRNSYYLKRLLGIVAHFSCVWHSSGGRTGLALIAAAPVIITGDFRSGPVPSSLWPSFWLIYLSCSRIRIGKTKRHSQRNLQRYFLPPPPPRNWVLGTGNWRMPQDAAKDKAERTFHKFKSVRWLW